MAQKISKVFKGSPGPESAPAKPPWESCARHSTECQAVGCTWALCTVLSSGLLNLRDGVMCHVLFQRKYHKHVQFSGSIMIMIDLAEPAHDWAKLIKIKEATLNWTSLIKTLLNKTQRPSMQLFHTISMSSESSQSLIFSHDLVAMTKYWWSLQTKKNTAKRPCKVRLKWRTWWAWQLNLFRCECDH